MRRATYLAKLNHHIAQGFAIVYIYARGFESETIRRYGYAPIGSPCIDRYNWQAKDRTNVIGALYGKMLFEPPRLYRRVIYLSQAAMPDRIKLS